jgi:Tol biopolymer transport system component
VIRVLHIPHDSLNLVCTVWSPDDRRLACEGWDDSDPSRTGIYTVRASDGGRLVRLTNPPPDTADLPGDYSPAGSQVLFKRAIEEANGELLVVSVRGGKPRQLSDKQVEDPGRYSPHGETVLTSVGGQIVLMDGSGREVATIAEEGAYLFGPVWSPDGSRIAFSKATSGPVADIYTALPDGTDRRRVTSTPEANEIRVEWGA